jgi:LPS-assembly lipoprotein
MWSHESRTALGRALRLTAAMAAAGLVAACFQPLYGDRTSPNGSELRARLASIDVAQIPAPQGTPESRIAVEIRNALVFDLTGGEGSVAPTHRLTMRMNTSKSALIVDVTTGRTEAEVAGIDINYSLTELATGKVVVNGTTFSRVSSDVPGQQQRFARARAQRDAEDRAAKVVAEQIRNRLTSYLVART